jgi:hypothetical protein
MKKQFTPFEGVLTVIVLLLIALLALVLYPVVSFIVTGG